VLFSIHIGSTDERNAVMLAHQTARHPKKNSYDTKAKVQVSTLISTTKYNNMHTEERL